MENSDRKMSEKELIKSRIIIVGISIAIAIAIYFLFFTKAKISIESTPENAVVTVDNKPITLKDGKANFNTNLGKHTLRVEADNYVGFKEEINLGRGSGYSKKVVLHKAPIPIEIGGGSEHIALHENNIYYQDTSDKLIYMAKIKFDDAGQAIVESKQAITGAPIVNVDDFIWSPTKDLALLKRGTNVSMLDFKKYDFVNQNETLFGKDIGDIAWSPDNSRVAYYYAPPSGEKSLIFADKSNGNITRALNFTELKIDNPYLAFSPSSEWLIIIPRNKNFEDNKVYAFNIYSKELRAVVNGGNQKEAVFSANSEKIIFSTFSANQQNPAKRELFVSNIDGNNTLRIGVAARATSVKYWNDPNKIFLLRNSDSSKLVLIDLSSGKTVDFFFEGQGESKISEIVLNDQKTGAIFISGGKLYFVKLEGNG